MEVNTYVRAYFEAKNALFLEKNILDDQNKFSACHTNCFIIQYRRLWAKTYKKCNLLSQPFQEVPVARIENWRTYGVVEWVYGAGNNFGELLSPH